jgi:hypothetical protein
MIERTLCKTLARSIILPINSTIDALRTECLEKKFRSVQRNPARRMPIIPLDMVDAQGIEPWTSPV